MRVAWSRVWAKGLLRKCCLHHQLILSWEASSDPKQVEGPL